MKCFQKWKWYFYLTFLHLRNISFFLQSLDNIILTGSHPSALSHEICLLFVESLGICLGKVTDGKTSEWFKIIETSCLGLVLTLECQLLLLFCNLKVIALLKTEFDDKNNWFFKITVRWGLLSRVRHFGPLFVNGRRSSILIYVEKKGVVDKEAAILTAN